MTYIPVFQISKKMDFIKVFQKILVFQNFGDPNPKVLKCRYSHFLERVILHLYWLFVWFALNSIFGEFLNIEPILVKVGVKWPHKTPIKKKILPISTKFGHSMSN